MRVPMTCWRPSASGEGSEGTTESKLMVFTEPPSAESIEEIREELEYDEEAGEYSVRVDLISIRPSCAVAVIATEIRGVDMDVMPSLEDAIYVEGMDVMFHLDSGATSLQFPYAGLSWAVQGTGWVVARETESEVSLQWD